MPRCSASGDLPGKIALPLDELHLWFCDYEECTDPQLQDSYRSLLSEDEKARELRFAFAKDRLRHLATRAALRTILSRYAGLRPEQWCFATNSHGRPEIAPSMSAGRWINFNISHTDSLIVLGLTRGHAIGVDVENWTVRDISSDLARRFFATEEVCDLLALPLDRQQYRFFENWTLKESYIKAHGMGLSIPLDQFSFRFPTADSVELATGPDLQDLPSAWHFLQWRPEPHYLVSVCVQQVAPELPTVIIRNTVPLVREELLASAPFRTSASRRRSGLAERFV